MFRVSSYSWYTEDLFETLAYKIGKLFFLFLFGSHILSEQDQENVFFCSITEHEIPLNIETNQPSLHLTYLKMDSGPNKPLSLDQKSIHG